MKILIYCDNSPRDLLGLKLLQRELEALGCTVKLCNPVNVKVLAAKFQPDGFVAARGDHSSPIRLISNACPVFIVPGEGGQQTKQTILSVFMGRSYWQLDDVSWINRCYLWGEQTKKWLMETGLFTEAQLKVCGNPRLDVYKFPEILNSEATSKVFTIGVAFSSKSTSNYFGTHSYAKAYFEMNPNLTFPITKAGRHYEDICWRDHAILRIMMRTIKGCLEKFPDCKIVLRPSPFEDPKAYLFLEKKLSGKVTVEVGEPLPLFVSKIDVLLTCWSTTGLEALIRNKPVISIAGMMDQKHLFEHISREASGFDTFVNLYECPNSQEEFYDLVAQIKGNTYSKSDEKKSMETSILHAIYAWPYEMPASALIAKDIVSQVRLTQKELVHSNENWAEVIQMPYNLPIAVAEIFYKIREQIRYIKSGAYKSYSSFHSVNNTKVRGLVKKYIFASKLNVK